MGLKRGDQLVVEELDNGSLVIRARAEAGEEGEKLSETTLEYSDWLERDLLSRYLMGYDVIRVVSKAKLMLEQKDRIKRAIAPLVGVEVVEEKANEVVLQCLLSPLAVPLKTLFKRADVIAQQMHRDSIKALVDRDAELAQSVVKRDEDLNRIYFLIVRQLRTIIRNPKLSQKAGVKLHECMDYRLAAKSIESIGDEAVSIAENVVKLVLSKVKLELEPEIVELSDLIDKMHADAFNSLMKADYALSTQVIDMGSKMRGMAEQLNVKALKLPLDVAFCASSIITELRIIGEICVDIADLVVRP
jgi:phosphate uptake regulator